MKKTDDIIESLTRDLQPVPAHALERRLVFAVFPALCVSLLLLLVFFGLRSDMIEARTELAFWIKSAYNALLAAIAFVAFIRLSRPDGDRGYFFVWVSLVLAAMAAIALVQLGFAVPDAYRTLIIGTALPDLDRGFCFACFPREPLGAQAGCCPGQSLPCRFCRRHCRRRIGCLGLFMVLHGKWHAFCVDLVFSRYFPDGPDRSFCRPSLAALVGCVLFHFQCGLPVPAFFDLQVRRKIRVPPC